MDERQLVSRLKASSSPKEPSFVLSEGQNDLVTLGLTRVSGLRPKEFR